MNSMMKRGATARGGSRGPDSPSARDVGFYLDLHGLVPAWSRGVALIACDRPDATLKRAPSK